MAASGGSSKPPSGSMAPASSAGSGRLSDPPSNPASFTLTGIGGSPGVAVGPALVIGASRASYTRRTVSSSKVDDEVTRVRAAVGEARAKLKAVSAELQAEPAPDQSAILEAYLLMLGDEFLHERVEKKIRKERMCAEWAVAAAGEEIGELFKKVAGKQDAYITERRHDIEFVCDRLLRALMGEAASVVPHLERPTVVIARDLSPADTAGMVREPVVGFVTEVGSRTSHTAIMARALEIPSVVGTADAVQNIRTGDMVVVDGIRGEVIVNPNPIVLEDARRRAARYLDYARGLLSARDRPCVTACGVAVGLRANVELPAEAVLALDHGAEGIGLYRTEFLYIDRATLPEEDEQYELYRTVVEAVGPRPVILRTFDIGGDKFASTFRLPAEMNPALGLRAVRLALSQPKVFKKQLRAMARASVHGDLRIMVPMVASVQELREVRRLLGECLAELEAEGHKVAPHIPLGAMIEVPSAAVMADVIAREADFFSIGTNDLVQYALAVDRTNRSLARMASPFHPSILRLIRGVCTAARERGISVSLCGAMASDPLAAPLLVGLGLRELSMEAAAIPEIKETIRRTTVAECEAAAEEALACESAEAVEEIVAKAFATRLYDLLSGEMTAADEV